MIAYIHGHICSQDGNMVTLIPEGIGIGYEVLVSQTLLPGIYTGGPLTAWIHHHKTDVSEALFAFSTPEERNLFRQLLKVNGVGGKTALSLLGMGERDLLEAIMNGDDVRIATVPGIGKKTAQKIIVDMKGSINLSEIANPGKKHPSQNTLIQSLIHMGYDRIQVEAVVEDINPTHSIEQQTIEAIKTLSQKL